MINKSYKTQLSNFLHQHFEKNKTPISFKELQTVLQSSNIDVNKTTIYRQLENMVQNNFLSAYQIGNNKVWETNHKHDNNLQHSHFTCDMCEKVICVEIDHKLVLTNSIKNIFKIHSINLTGICKHCTH